MCDRRLMFALVLCASSSVFGMEWFNSAVLRRKKSEKIEKPEKMNWLPTKVYAQYQQPRVVVSLDILPADILPNDPENLIASGKMYFQLGWVDSLYACMVHAENVFKPHQALVILAMLDNSQAELHSQMQFVAFLNEKVTKGDEQAKRIAALLSNFIAPAQAPVLQSSNAKQYAANTMLDGSFNESVMKKLQAVAKQRAMEID